MDASHTTLSMLISFVVGFLFLTGNFLVIRWSWAKILEKKLVALVVSVIVIKYAVIAMLLMSLIKQNWFEPISFVLGGSLLVVVGLVWQQRLATNS